LKQEFLAFSQEGVERPSEGEIMMNKDFVLSRRDEIIEKTCNNHSVGEYVFTIFTMDKYVNLIIYGWIPLWTGIKPTPRFATTSFASF
jgi:hypothetical protein